MNPDPQHACRISPPRPPSRSRVKSTAVGEALHLQIEALIPRLRRYARALVRDPVAADDLVQDCLARALGKIHQWHEGTDLRAWLFTILHNQHISLARRIERERDNIELQKSDPDLALSPDQTAGLELRDLERAIAKLSEEQRAVILLTGLEGMGYDEIASVLNLPVGTVRSRLSRGRETLRVLTGSFPIRHRLATKAPSRPARSANRGFYRFMSWCRHVHTASPPWSLAEILS
jgi:RNA polymerase sigma-70 factor, ECF subfamily